MAEGMVQLPTILEGNGGFGGMSMGAGFIGGLVLGSLWNGNGFGGWGGRGAGQVGADVALQNGIQNLSNQVQQNAISQLQSANQMGLQVVNSAAGIAAGIDAAGDQATAAINAANVQGMQNAQMMADRMCAINGNITSQGFENRLQAQALAAQLQNQHAQLSAQIASENCADRELMREIASQAVRDKLAEEQAKNAALTAQINLSNQLQAQTLYLINQLKPAATTTAGAATTAGA